MDPRRRDPRRAHAQPPPEAQNAAPSEATLTQEQNFVPTGLQESDGQPPPLNGHSRRVQLRQPLFCIVCASNQVCEDIFS
jgi:hypothetical protein